MIDAVAYAVHRPRRCTALAGLVATTVALGVAAGATALAVIEVVLATS